MHVPGLRFFREGGHDFSRAVDGVRLWAAPAAEGYVQNVLASRTIKRRQEEQKRVG